MSQTKIDTLTPDAHNANRGTERGTAMLKESLSRYGAGRSILLDKHGTIIAGNKTIAMAKQLGMSDVVIVETDGTQIVAVKRTDLDFTDGTKARALAYADNRVGEVDFDLDPAQLAADANAGVDLSAFWCDEEIDDAIAQEEFWSVFESSMVDGGDAKSERKLDEKAHSIKAVICTEDIAIVEEALRETGEMNRGKALVQICRMFLHEKR
jgi:hypothetical protein